MEASGYSIQTIKKIAENHTFAMVSRLPSALITPPQWTRKERGHDLIFPRLIGPITIEVKGRTKKELDFGTKNDGDYVISDFLVYVRVANGLPDLSLVVPLNILRTVERKSGPRNYRYDLSKIVNWESYIDAWNLLEEPVK